MSVHDCACRQMAKGNEGVDLLLQPTSSGPESLTCIAQVPRGASWTQSASCLHDVMNTSATASQVICPKAFSFVVHGMQDVFC